MTKKDPKILTWNTQITESVKPKAAVRQKLFEKWQQDVDGVSGAVTTVGGAGTGLATGRFELIRG